MGTNYYMINKKVKEVIDKEYPLDTMEDLHETMIGINSVHLGKSSAGWKMLLRSNPLIADCFKAWKYILGSGKYEIYDEYDKLIPVENFIELVEQKQHLKSHVGIGVDVYVDDEGYEFHNEEFC